MSSAEKISISMAADMLRVITDAVRTGEFASMSEALHEAVNVWQRQRLDDAERLMTIRRRVRGSLDDPRPDLDEETVERHLGNLHAETVKAHRGAKA